MNQMLQENNGRKSCKFCLWPLPDHGELCPLRRIRPGVLLDAKSQAAEELKKNVNKQRIFKSDPPPRSWPRPLPGAGGSIVKRKPSTKPKKVIDQEIKYCYWCEEKKLMRRGRGGKWTCTTCERNRKGE